jgi:hypothetical protein
MSAWQTMESAPKDGTWFLAYWRDEMAVVRKTERGAWEDSSYTTWCEAWDLPQCWMPLPAPPLPGESNARIIAGPHKETR